MGDEDEVFDRELLDEIELLTQLIAVASDLTRSLTSADIDAVLGVAAPAGGLPFQRSLLVQVVHELVRAHVPNRRVDALRKGPGPAVHVRMGLGPVVRPFAI